MDAISAPAVCALAAWSALAPGVRISEGRCGDAPVWVVEVDPSAARFTISAPGPSRTTAEFAAATGAVVAVNGGLFDVHELPMGPTRGGGEDWSISARKTFSGVFGAAGPRRPVRLAPTR